MNFKKLLKKKGRNLIIINAVCIVIFIGILFLCNDNNDLVSALKGYTKVDSNEELEEKFKDDRYVEIVFDEFYLTNYYYDVDGREAAYYIELNVDNMGVIAKVSPKVYNDLKDGKITGVKGHLETPVGEDYKAQSAIIREAIAYAIETYPELKGLEDEMAQTYHEFQLINYEESTSWAYIIVTLFGVAIIANIFLIVKGTQGISHPDRLKQFKGFTFSDLESEFDKGTYNYQTKNVIMSNKYIYSLGLAGVQVASIDDVLWAYIHIQKQNGIQVNKSIVLRLKNKKQFLVSDKNDAFFTALANIKPNVLIGFTPENQKAYKEMTK